MKCLRLKQKIMFLCVIGWTIFCLVSLGVNRVNALSYEIIDLGTLGGTFSGTRGINDSGQIVGRSQTSSGEDRAVLWNPVDPIPEPSTWLLLCFGLIGIVGIKKKFS